MAEVRLFEHPDYAAKRDEWAFLKSLYDGKHDVIVNDPNILWPLYEETRDDKTAKELLKERRQRTRYLNIPEIIVSIWISFFFRKDPTFSEEATKQFDDQLNNVDGFGTTFVKMLKKNLENYLLYGKMASLVDSLAAGDKKRPFVSIIHPLDFVDWDIETNDSNRVGLYNAARINTVAVSSRSRLTKAPEVMQLSNELYLDSNYTRQQYKTENKTGHVSEENKKYVPLGGPITSDIDFIPIVVSEDVSWIKDVAQETLRHLNLRSSKDSTEHAQCFQKNFIIGIAPGDAAAVAAMSEHIWRFLPAGCTVHTVPEVNTTSIAQSIDQAIDNAFKVGLNLLRQVAAGSKAVQSDDSISSEKDERLALVESTIYEIEDFGNRILRNMGVFAGASDDQIELFTVEMDKDLTSESINEFITIYGAFRDLIGKYSEVNKQAAIKAVSKLFDGTVKDDLIKIIEDVEAEQDQEPAQPPVTVVPDAFNIGNLEEPPDDEPDTEESGE
jgi:hypothetical protein